MSEIIQADAIKEIVKLSAIQASARQFTLNNGEVSAPFVIVPQNTELKALEHLFAPQYIKQRVTLLDAGSFIEYVNKFKTSATLIFANVGADSATFTAVLDYHHGDTSEAARCAHVATFTTMVTPQWATWLEANKKRMTQLQFAEWLEENAELFREPTGAALLEIVTTLEGKQEVRFTSGMRLQSGANELSYEEDVNAAGGSGTRAGKLKIPQIVTAGIAPFHGASPYKVQARLKYRIESRKVTFWLETINLAGITRDALLLIAKEIGSPEKPEGKDGKAGTGIVPLLGNLQ
jgi:uncharacterized protein YfdQ (DUF2303 family)